MIRALHNSTLFKCITAFISLNLLVDAFLPTAAWALTSGPTQPEMASFSPVGTSDLVNPFTGDFSYNTHLLTVPGPGGGYPVNLAYQAGAGLEEEASWVGLGWNVNAGSVNRMMRGLPDDFSGDIVEKKQTSRPYRTLSAELDLVPANSEIYGLDLSKVKPGLTNQLYFNNYRGFGYKVGGSFSMMLASNKKSPFIGSLGFSYDSQSGLGVSPGLSFEREGKNNKQKFNGGLSFNSRQGLQSFHFGGNREIRTKRASFTITKDKLGKYHGKFSPSERSYTSRGTGTSFASGSSIPYSEFPTYSAGFQYTIKGGATILGTTYDKDIAIGYSQNGIAENSQEYNAYGYLHASNSEGALLDFNMERNSPVTKSSEVIPIPNFTYDVYNATAQGAGGTFRPHRSEIGMLRHPNVAPVPQVDVAIGPEIEGGAGEIKIGGDFGYTESYSWSGSWGNGSADAIDHFKFLNSSSTNDPLYEPSFFKAAGEQTSERMETSALNDANPYHFEITQTWEGMAPKARIRNLIKDQNDNPQELNAGDTYRKERQKRSQLFNHLTQGELAANPSDAKITYNGTDYSTYSHLGEITVTNPDGRRFIYAEPVYNLEQKEVIFSVEHDYDGTNAPYYQGSNAKLTLYDITDKDNSLENKKGNDHFYSSTKLPPYTTGHLLTAVVSSDYIDLEDDGLSADDLGSWTRFDYVTPMGVSNPYKWRAPFNQAHRMANLMMGNLSDNQDDKAAYAYGAKEVKYLKSIETKTHIAYFTTSDREDGLPVIDENEGKDVNGPRLQKLDKIELYKKLDPYNPDSTADYLIRTVYFEYSYDLCPGVPNNSGTSTISVVGEHPRYSNQSANRLGGKLTLEKVYFINGNPKHNNVGQLSPYVFDYHTRYVSGDVIPAGKSIGDAHLLYNPPYANGHMDRWGNYQYDGDTYRNNHEHPYTFQQSDYLEDSSCGIADSLDVEARNAAASAWCIRQVHLPSGGTIEVEYEADEYAFVEDKPAMQMSRIVNTRKADGTLGDGRIDDDYVQIIFELDEPIPTTNAAAAEAKLKNYLQGIEDVYFKTYQRLKVLPTGHPGQFDESFFNDKFAYDYVDGYAPTNFDLNTGDGYGFDNTSVCNGLDQVSYYTRAYFEVDKVKLGNSTSAGKVNPIRKAGFQYLQLQRPDLFRAPNNVGGNIATATQVITPATQMVKIGLEATRMILGFNRFAKTNGFCKELDIRSTSRPSFVRLNSGPSKYGGGHRVKRLSLHDNWDAMSGEGDYAYGQEFSYQMEDGSSAGVASYEPLIGGEEIPHRTPIRYSSEHLIKRDEALYVENPLMENFYPAPIVGYQRILVKNIDREIGNEKVTRTAEGIRVQEFYTAKDYPVYDSRTSLKKKIYNIPIEIPFIGSISVNSRGVSQGFSIELNDMHGKQKSEAVYNYDHDPFQESPISKTEYFYHTTGRGYNPRGENRLNNEVQVLYADGDQRLEHLGQTVDMYAHQQENYVFSQGVAIVPNATVDPPKLLAVLTAIPYLHANEGIYRSIATTKIISKTGILSHIRNTTEGAVVETHNKIFDAYTGNALLTSVSNSYKDPVYNYEMPAHWSYESMEPAYQNIGVRISDLSTQAHLLHPGDVLLDQGNTRQKYWVESTDPSVVLRDRANAVHPSTTGNWLIIRSGHRNQHTVPAGNLVSLEDPIATREFPLFDQWNQNSTPSAGKSLTVTDCYSGISKTIVTNNANPNTLRFAGNATNETCIAIAEFPDPLPSNIGEYELTMAGKTIIATYQGITLRGTWSDTTGCFRQCLDGVLNASAVTFEHEWDYNYAEAGFDTTAANTFNSNPYRYGGKGIFRAEGSWVYQSDRTQTAHAGDTRQTNVREDGVYEDFVLFNWLHQETAKDPVYALEQKPWIKATKINHYDPYGYEIEEQDALGNHSAALYGYGKTVPTAVGANLEYKELAFDGFEDYTSNLYVLPGHGRMNLTTNSGVPTISTVEAHTGKASLQVAASLPVSFTKDIGASDFSSLHTYAGKTYRLSAWVKPGNNSNMSVVTSYFDHLGTAISTDTLAKTDLAVDYIEGWLRVSKAFTVPASAKTITLQIVATGTEGYIDDLRIQPENSAIKTFVYDPITLRLVAELDAHNFATFYNYDLEGTLVQTKKETERGVMTLQNTRSHLRKVSNP